MKHGTRYAYERGGCRCQPCRSLQTRRRKSQREKQNALGAPINHGNVTAYVGRKCRCPECREAWRLFSTPYAREWERKQRNKITAPFGSDKWRESQKEFGRKTLRDACASNAELAALVAAQEKDARVGHYAESRWLISLQSTTYARGLILADRVADPNSEDPLAVLLAQEVA